MSAWSLALACALGAVLGSFGNVLVARLPAGLPLGGRSRCDGCGRPLGVVDLLPVFGAVLRRGRAPCCGARFGWAYALWEFLTVLLFAAAWQASPGLPEGLVFGTCLWLLTLIARIDAATQMIPDALSLALIAAGGALAVLYGEVPLAAVALCLAVFGGQWVLSRGRWLGSGDVVLSVGIALMVRHVELAALTILLAYVLGAAFAAALLALRRASLGGVIAFGPFLCVAAIAASLLGDRALARLLG